MEYEIITKSENLDSLKEDWERIEKTSISYTYFSTFKYCSTWVKNINYSEIELFIIKILHNNKVIGIAPLQITKRKKNLVSRKVLEFINVGDYADFLIDYNSKIKHIKIIKRIFEIIQDNGNKWEELYLTNICNTSLLSYYLLSSKYNKYYKVLVEAPYIDFTNYSSLEEYRKYYLPKKVKQYINRLNREKNIKLVITRDNVINSISKIHKKEKEFLSKKGIKNRYSLFDIPERYHFLDKLYTENENILTYLLINEAEDEIICYYTGYIYNDRFHSYNTAYNPKYEGYSVGKIFNYLIFEINDKEKLWNVFDMGAGRYEWKFEWTNSNNLLYKLNIENFKNRRKKIVQKTIKIISYIFRIAKEKY